MPAPHWPQPTAVIERLLAQPQNFEFFQAVRLLQRWLAQGQGVAPDEALSKRLRYRNSLSLSFPAGEIESLSLRMRMPDGEGASAAPLSQVDGAPTADPDHAAGPPRAADVLGVMLTPAFFGLLGSQGALPHHYTEQIAQREVFPHRDPSARAFLDIFTNRALALFQAAWVKHRLHLQYELDREQRFLPLVLALAGLGQSSLRQRLGPDAGGVGDEAVAYFAGAVQRRAVSAVQMQQVLGGYLGVPVHVDSFIGRWYSLPPEAVTSLGSRGTLGQDALVGERVWQRDLTVRVVLGPLDRSHYLRFLPGGAGERALQRWCHLLLGVSLDVEVRLRLKREAVAGIALDSVSDIDANGVCAVGRLGWDTFLRTEPETEDREDVVYDLTLH